MTRMVILEKTVIMRALVHFIFIVHHLQWRHHLVSNIQLVIWVVPNLMFLLVMVYVVWDLGPTTLPPRNLIVELMVEILCDIKVGNIHP